MNIATLTAATKLLTGQASIQLTLMASGVSTQEACLATCAVALLAPLFSNTVHQLYRQAFLGHKL